MANFPNPIVIVEGHSPADQDIVVFEAATGTWSTQAAAALGALTPQAPPSEPTQSSDDIATTAPTNTTPYGYSTSAQAADVLTTLNELVTDVAALVTWADALQAKLVSSGILT